LQILAKRIIVDIGGEIGEDILSLPFAYLRSLMQNLSTPEAGMVVRNMSDQGYFHTNQISLSRFLRQLIEELELICTPG
jgi:hypothetical protein